MSTLSKILVLLQFLCFFYFAFFTEILVSGFGLFVQVFAASLCIWAVIVMKPGRFNVQPEVKSNAVFVSNGPYRIIRNPMYLGLILFFGVIVFYEPIILNLLFYLTLVAVFLLKIKLEERFLLKNFGQVYKEYKTKSYRLVPYLYFIPILFTI
ncbi:isoprenylcysteine carboxylmethyltransferase family protein [Lutimonas saemankumensis]|uniref:methyltransferase family protein n=1 Tax=Lutimonas saemankumensis TaxID=483016 RepID=UPI001CD24FD2|nr:isoprenylcysteine carboxylmethyltransferase family protein [Lutimonas saemankumensis]MCA0931229.1 isoprenylcysteine carboxylmethyltransferase family protein [Lutimonas saemankumensis]